MPEYREVNFNQLSKADVIFMTSNSPESAGIRQLKKKRKDTEEWVIGRTTKVIS